MSTTPANVVFATLSVRNCHRIVTCFIADNKDNLSEADVDVNVAAVPKNGSGISIL